MGAEEGTPVVVEATPEFDWKSWDGSETTVPETHREYASPVIAHYQGKLEEAERNFKEREETIFKQLLDDPDGSERVKSLEDKIKGLEEQLNLTSEEANREYARWFKRTYPDLYENEALKTKVVELIEADWEPEVAAELVHMSDEAIEVAKKAHAAGTPVEYAMQLAKLHDRSTVATVPPATVTKVEAPAATLVPPPNAAAKATAGSGPTSSPAPQKRRPRDRRNLDEAREIAIANNV
jgi:hypothetical protein